MFVFGYYLFGLLTVTGIGFTSTMTFRPNISWTPFIGMITGPIDTILNIILFVPLGFFLPLLYKKYHHMKTVALTGFLFSLAVEIVQMFGWGSSDINDLMTNTAGACIGFFSLLSAVKNLACQSEKATSIQPCQCCGWSTSLCYLHICHYGHGSDLVCPWCAECSINCIGNNRSQI